MGNITSKVELAYTTAETSTLDTSNGTVTSYGYVSGGLLPWGDRLVNYNGTTISYDNIGNPSNWRNASEFVWSARELVSATLSDNSTLNFTYNADGIRTQKVYNNTVHNYILDGSKIIKEEVSVNGTTSYELYYIYDASGSIVGFQHDNNPYYFLKNLQGDVVSIVNTLGVIVVEYTYDAWGKLLSTTGTLASTIGTYNPFRYRGYYYDTETGWYYLQSRYYDPIVGRFLNADGMMAGVSDSVQGYNLYAYCFNNPINLNDSDGNWPKWIKNTVKWVAKNIVKPVVKTVQKTLSKVDLTYSSGFNVSGTPSAWIFNGQIGVSVDTKGNVAIQASGGGGITGGDPGISITSYQSITNAPEIDKLNDEYYQVGGSIAVPIEGVPVAAGGDVMLIPDPELNTAYFGLTGNAGFGTPGKEFHVEWGTTDTLPYSQINIYEVARSVYIEIMEW